MSLRSIPIVTALVLSACTPARGGGSGGREGTAPLDRPTGPVGLEEARRYVLGLVNRDRAEADLPPVERDEVAERAGQRHVDDMVKHGFTAHWGTDGSVPEQRYTESGGVHFAQENAACFFDGTVRELDPNPTFSPDQLEQIESAFVHETPPNDGHRKNILKKWHNKLGVGLGKPVGIEQPCMAQEFVDEYGEYDGLPQRATLGQKISVAGEIARAGGVWRGRPRANRACQEARRGAPERDVVVSSAEPRRPVFPGGVQDAKTGEARGKALQYRPRSSATRRSRSLSSQRLGALPG